MRHSLLSLLFCLLLASPAIAQVLAPATIPLATAPAAAPVAPADPYTVSAIAIDMPVASAQEARDTALLAAERQALQKLKEQLAATGDTSAAAITEPSDLQLARMVQNFEVANERLSAKRYSGTFTIRFRPNVVARAAPQVEQPVDPSAATASLTALYRFSSLQQWTTVQQRLLASGVVKSVDLQAIGRGYIRAGLNYNGSTDTLTHALAAQGLQLQSNNGAGWLLTGTEG